MSLLKSYCAVTVVDLGVRPDQKEHAESYLWQVEEHWWKKGLGQKPFQLKLENIFYRGLLVSI